MIPDNYTKKIQDKLITDLSALTYENGDVVFGTVKALVINPEVARPICEIMPTNFVIIQDGISFDTRQEGFLISIIDTIEASDTDAQAKEVVDRITEIKGRILRYLEKVPNILDWNLTEIEIYNVRVTNGSVQVGSTDRGVALICEINVTFDIRIAIRQDL